MIARIAIAHTGPRLVAQVAAFCVLWAAVELSIRAVRRLVRKHRDPYRALAARDRSRR